MSVGGAAGPVSDPLILTLWMDDESSASFDALRRAHFPVERNLIPAHLTLFHHLPGQELPAVEAVLKALCEQQAAFELPVTGLRSLGRGVAFTLNSEQLAALRKALAAHWQDKLGAQDQQAFRPHVTIQNKVTPEEARLLLNRLSEGFEPFTIKARGLLLWRYLGGPWEQLSRFPFSS